MRDAAYWIDHLELAPHPEGGFYRQTYRSDLTLSHSALPQNFKGDRSASTAIYFLLADDDFSAFHRISSDEMWHFYAGDSLEINVIDSNGHHSVIKLGTDTDEGEQFQAVVPAECWFAACLKGSNTFALVGCTVAPGFDFADFEIGTRPGLIAQFPQHAKLFERLTRDPTTSPILDL